MQGFVTTHEGAEDIAREELKLFGIDAKDLIFECTPEQLAHIAYAGQSFTDAGIYLGKLGEDNTVPKEVLQYLPKTFSVRGMGDLNGEIGGKILDLSPESKVDLKKPQLKFIVFDGSIGLEVASFDLSKRDYKVFHHPASIKGTLAYCLVMLSGYSPGKVLVDPFCISGEIPIEAAMRSVHPVHYFRKQEFLFNNLGLAIDLSQFDAPQAQAHASGMHKQLTFVHSAQKNAKIAGVQKAVSLVRGEIEWLDTKFEESSVDCIATIVPRNDKVFKELFYQAEFVMKKGGRMALCSHAIEDLKQAAAEYKFKLLSERILMQGQEALPVATFERV